jgi:Ca2+-binding RTX toxin-like protein
MADILGTDDAELLNGGEDNDTITALAGDDTVYGGGTVSGGSDDLIFGGDGNDSLDGRGGNDTLWGGFGNDYLYGDGQDDLLYGDAGKDGLSGGDGSDTLYGGDGNDWLNGIRFDTDTEALDVLYGGAGNDTLRSGTWEEWNVVVDATLVGGIGNDLYYIDSATDVVVENPDEGFDHLVAYGFSVNLLDIQNIESAVAEGDGLSLQGSDIANQLKVIGEDSTIRGGAGDDKIDLLGSGLVYGDGGNDTIAGAYSIELVYGGAGDDVVTLKGRESGRPDPRSLYGGAGDDSLTSQSQAGIFGGTGNDTLNAADVSKGKSTLFGGAGDDIIFGARIGHFVGGAGDDTYYYCGPDIVEKAGGGYDVVISDRDIRVLKGVELEELRLRKNADTGRIFGGSGDEKIFGSDGMNFLFGGQGDDTIQAGGGRAGAIDYIFGGVGADLLFGGHGEDLFNYSMATHSNKENGYDRITDFRSNEDTIWLSRMEGGTFVGSKAFSGEVDEVRYQRSTGWLEGDMNGDGIADWRIKFLNKVNLQADDLHFGAL